MKLIYRFKAACLTLLTAKDWLWAAALLLIYGLIYLPIGLTSGFLRLDLQSSASTVVGVMVGAAWMPGLSEELFFRVLIIPHPTETVPPSMRWQLISLSWLSFLLYHWLNPFAPLFFRNPVFLLGAALIGTICTIAYLKSGSLWIPVVIHWLIVIVWLLCLGGLARFQH